MIIFERLDMEVHMNVLYLILLLLSAVCFALEVATDHRQITRIHFVALGLFFWVLVPLIQTIDQL